MARTKQEQLVRRLQGFAGVLRKAVKPALFTVLMAFGAGKAQAQLVFNEGQNAALQVGGFVSMVDIDADSDFDAFVGDASGDIYYWLNTGSDTSAQFTLQAGSSNPFDTVDIGTFARPEFVDIDGDGDYDMFLGGYNSKLLYYENTGSASAALFTERTGSNHPLDIVVNGYTSVSFVDIDNDGDMDAFVTGTVNATIDFYLNTGTAIAPVFTLQTGTNNPFNSLGLGYYYMDFVDIDKDGDMDAFLTKVGVYEVEYYRNIGTNQSASFSLVSGTGNPFDGAGATVDVQDIEFVDLDGDGDMDAFLGSSVVNSRYFINETINYPNAVLSVQEALQLRLFPNPTKGLLNFEKPMSGYFTVYNTLGQAVYGSILTGDRQVDIAHLPAGTYTVYMLSEENGVLVTKFVKE